MTEKNMWNLSPEEALKACQTSEQGLSTEQAEKIRLEAGENMLKEGKKKSPFQVFLDQFKDLMVVILIGAAIISMFSGNEESTIVIFAVLVMNAVLGTIQHVKAEKSLESLKQLSAPAAKVIRDGIKQEIPAKDVVPGDILELEAGDMVAADGRILHNYSLQVNESSLTGESTNVDKQEMALEGEVALADRTNMVYSGSLVAYGRATVLVTATGMNTEIGKIAGLMNSAQERKTPLQKSLDQFSGKLAVLIMIVCALVFALCMFRKMTLLDSLLFAVALAVAAIPEALTSIVTIVQAFGTQKMAKENAIIKKLKAVESLGCVSVICSDKTGTLTQNSLRAEAVCINGKIMDTGQLKKYSHHPDLSLFLRSAILANNASGEETGEKEDPLEQALLHMAEEAGKDPGLLRRQWRRISEIPFNSDKKYMGAICSKGGEKILFVKGAVDVLLSKCSLAVNPSFQEEETASWGRPFSFSDKERILRQNGLWSKKGMRVLALACKPLKEEEIRDAKAENMIFLGLAAMTDPPRPESKMAVADAKKAGIRTVMITGDHKETAAAIASEIGIFTAGDLAVTGADLDQMSDQQLQERLEKISVYARVSPEHKIRIVEAWQKKGHITAMTGDGVNDAPALKKADIGIAMGKAGTEVSRDAAAMILTDDNFATIIKAVANGRNVYRNIKNSIQFLLSGNMAGILCVLYTSIKALPLPFAPVHLLFINLLTDSLPAIAIGMEPADRDLLNQPPRDPKEGILSFPFAGKILFQGFLIGAATMWAWEMGYSQGGEAIASTMAFSTLTLARLFHGFNCRGRKSLLSLGIGSNLWCVMALFVGVVLMCAVLFVPQLQDVFAAGDLTGSQLLAVVLGALAPTAVIQIYKIMSAGTA